MSSKISFATSVRNAMLDAIKTALDAGPGPGVIKVYSGPRPTTGAPITTQVLLAQLTLSDPSAPAAALGTLTFNPVTSDLAANASGTAVWARAETSAGAHVFDCSVSTTTGSGALKFNSVSFVLNSQIDLSSLVITLGP